MEKSNFEQELRNIAPGLKNQSRENPFTVPDGYFEELPQHIATKIASTNNKLSVFPAFQKILRPVAVAASVLVFAISAFLLLQKSENGNLLSESELMVYENSLAWYSEYQTGVYYDILLDEAEEYEEELDSNAVIEYFMDHHGYNLEYVLVEIDN